MIHRAIKVKVIKEGQKRLTLLLTASNSRMQVNRPDFERRVDNGTYIVTNPEVLSTKE